MELCSGVLLPGCSNTSVTNRCGSAVITLIRYSIYIYHFIGHVFKLISTQTGYKIYFFHFFVFLYPPQTLFVGGILFSRCPSVRASVCPSVTLCFLNNSKNHCWIFIKPCKHVHICKTNTLYKKVRARGQFY